MADQKVITLGANRELFGRLMILAKSSERSPQVRFTNSAILPGPPRLQWHSSTNLAAAPLGLNCCQRFDVGFGQYCSLSIKAGEREKRSRELGGKGTGCSAKWEKEMKIPPSPTPKAYSNK